MSHFATLVVTAQPPSSEVLTAALQPFHEFECTGDVDQYVQNVDQLQEALAEFADRTERRLKAPDGTLFRPYDDQFYQDPTPEESKKIGPIAGTGGGHGLSWTSKDWGDGRGYRTKVRFIPEGFEEVELNTKDTQTFAEWVVDYYSRPLLAEGAAPDLEGDHKWGWYRTNAQGEVVELIDRTNPNKKWDWWTVGGRYGKRFFLKGSDTPCDTGLKSEIDWDRMTEEKRKGRIAAVEKYLDAAAAKAGTDREGILAAHREASARYVVLKAEYDALPKEERGAFADFVKSKEEAAFKMVLDSDLWGMTGLCGYFGMSMPESEADPIAWAGNVPAFSSFAFLRDGKWAERGEMGWWASVTNENADWDEQFQELLNAVPDDHYLTVVDCHI